MKGYISMFNDNTINGICCASELEKILKGTGNSPQSRLDLPSCEIDSPTYGVKGYPLAMVYSPVQEFGNLYEIDKGFNKGTIFSELDLPFMGRSLAKKGVAGGCYDK